MTHLVQILLLGLAPARHVSAGRAHLLTQHGDRAQRGTGRAPRDAGRP